MSTKNSDDKSNTTVLTFGNSGSIAILGIPETYRMHNSQMFSDAAKNLASGHDDVTLHADRLNHTADVLVLDSNLTSGVVGSLTLATSWAHDHWIYQHTADGSISTVPGAVLLAENDVAWNALQANIADVVKHAVRVCTNGGQNATLDPDRLVVEVTNLLIGTRPSERSSQDDVDHLKTSPVKLRKRGQSDVLQCIDEVGFFDTPPYAEPSMSGVVDEVDTSTSSQ